MIVIDMLRCHADADAEGSCVMPLPRRFAGLAAVEAAAFACRRLMRRCFRHAALMSPQRRWRRHADTLMRAAYFDVAIDDDALFRAEPASIRQR